MSAARSQVARPQGTESLAVVWLARIESPEGSVVFPFTTRERAAAWVVSQIAPEDFAQWEASRRADNPDVHVPAPGIDPDEDVLADWYGQPVVSSEAGLVRVEYGIGFEFHVVIQQVRLDSPTTTSHQEY